MAAVQVLSCNHACPDIGIADRPWINQHTDGDVNPFHGFIETKIVDGNDI